MTTKTVDPAAERPYDRIAHALVWVGNLMHGLGASMLKARHAELAAELARTRAVLAELNDEYEKLVSAPASEAPDVQAPGTEATP